MRLGLTSCETPGPLVPVRTAFPRVTTGKFHIPWKLPQKEEVAGTQTGPKEGDKPPSGSGAAQGMGWPGSRLGRGQEGGTMAEDGVRGQPLGCTGEEGVATVGAAACLSLSS